MRFLQRYLPLFYRKEQRENAVIVVEGLLSGLERKTCEPIAREHGVQRKPVQSFVGCGKWDDQSVMGELRRHVKEHMSDADAVLVLDSSAFAKKGGESCGVKRQWCGRLGKQENCQVGVFLCYAAAKGHAPLDRQLYLPQEWAEDVDRREKCHVPPGVEFQEKWRIGLELMDRCREEMPHAWTTADDEFGRCIEFRRGLRDRKERYVLDVPGKTLVRDLEARRPRRKRAGKGQKRKVPFVGAGQWAARQPQSRWQRITVRAGRKGPLVVEAMTARVVTKDKVHRTGAEERLVVIRQADNPSEVSYALSNAEGQVPLAELVRVKCQRHRIEEMFEEGKGEAGLSHYEVRSWVGWHHHMTLALLALWFLILEKSRIGKKKLPRRHGSTGPGDLLPPVA